MTPDQEQTPQNKSDDDYLKDYRAEAQGRQQELDLYCDLIEAKASCYVLEQQLRLAQLERDVRRLLRKISHQKRHLLVESDLDDIQKDVAYLRGLD